ncbi:hypothetical protein CKAH01_15113 [Colletotrichum kahawae]|uniref:Uncharacterized protein n=1 Tax=Colletotrichum kahawae TaxID=34407 RepID=A0AAE0DBG7_COLKA|nr:hypothetical protein CKAH01_15113 [Colletotrichum kahawae]
MGSDTSCPRPPTNTSTTEGIR